MEAKLMDFRSELLNRVSAEAAGEDASNAFVSTAGEMLEEAEEFVDFVPSVFRGVGSRRRSIGIDGYSFDDADGSLRLLIVEYGGSVEPHVLNQTSAKGIFRKAVAFVEDVVQGVDLANALVDGPAADLANLIKTHQAAITRLRFYLATDGLLSDRIRDWPDEIIETIPTEFHIWDISRFEAACASQLGREALTVDFSAIVPDGLPCLKASLHQTEYGGYLCVIPGDALSQIYEEYGSRLLEGNVRSFLGKTGKVNRAIRETIIKSPEMFFAFNNGIAATASSVETAVTADGLKLLSATDLQIVNGGQTTASLAFTRRRDGAELGSIFVQMKLSVVAESRSGELIPKISEFANKQNKVSDSDLFSNHEFHRKLEELSRRLSAPAKSGALRTSKWFYERVKGQYRIETAKMSPSEKTRFEADNPRAQLMTKTDLAKVENSWRMLPHEVSKGAQKNFDLFSKYVVAEWARNPLQFNDEYFRTIVAHTIIFRELERMIPKQVWFEGGYRANVVTYSISKLAELIDRLGNNRVLNCQAIWKQQGVSAALSAQLAAIAQAIYSVITMPESGLENVTEWAKKELCWLRAIELPLVLNEDFVVELVDAAEVQERAAFASVDAKVDKGLAALSAVLSFSHANWKALRDWGIKERELTPKEDQLLMVAANPTRLPSDKQAAAVLLIRRRLESHGFSA